MNDLVSIALYGWIPVAVSLFFFLPPHRAVIAAFLFAWLFLPQGSIVFVGFPDLNKVTATSFGALLGVLLFDAGRLLQYRFSWVDIPILVWCCTPMASSLTNGFPFQDGISNILHQLAIWGVPYLVGRLYFNTLPAMRELALGILIGGLVYVPLCLWEIRMSPQLHNFVYGYHPSAFVQSIRYGGYRPMVFMQHGLMVGLWMTAASLTGVWLVSCRSVRSLFRAPASWLVGALLLTTILCKSTGALALLIVGLATLFAVRFSKLSLVVVLVVAMTPAYILVRATGTWSGEQLVQAASLINEDRADSLAGRLLTDDMLARRAAGKALFGWGSWGDWRVRDEETGEDITVSDSMWIITFGQYGLSGLVSFTVTLLLPVLLLLMRIRARHWSHPAVAPAAVLAMLLVVFSLDSLLNAMLNPVFTLGAGALSGFYILAPKLKAQARRQDMAARAGPPVPAPPAYPPQ